MTERKRGSGEELACCVVGDSEKGRYLVLKSLSGKTANVLAPYSDYENTCRPELENSGPKTIIYYNSFKYIQNLYYSLIYFP